MPSVVEIVALARTWCAVSGRRSAQAGTAGRWRARSLRRSRLRKALGKATALLVAVAPKPESERQAEPVLGSCDTLRTHYTKAQLAMYQAERVTRKRGGRRRRSNTKSGESPKSPSEGPSIEELAKEVGVV